MRSISADLLAKIQKSQQTIYQNANPALKVLLSKGFRKDLFRVYTIHNDELLEGLDVAVRRMDTLNKPNKVFVVYIKDGVAHLKSKDLPYDETIAWTYEFEIGSADEVATEFDGYWEREGTSGRWNLITGEYPYTFKVVAGELFVQLWDGTPISLATGVSKISAARGWRPSNGHATSDQGLIISYIKTDGTVWYRTYALQIGDFQAWEAERQIAEFTKTATEISTFRTNDFRVGFVVKNSDNTVELLLTTRNWAGMSFEPEYINVGLDITMEVTPITYYDTKEDENISAELDIWLNVAEPIYPEVISAEHTSDWVITVMFSHLIDIDLSTVASAFTVKDSNNVTFGIINTEAGTDNSVLILNMNNFSGAFGDMTVNYDRAVIELDVVHQGSRFAIESFAKGFTPDIEPPEGFVTEYLSAGITNIVFTVSQASYTNTFGIENITIGLLPTIVVTKVGDNPL